MLHKIKEYFRRDDINVSRQANIDYAKVLAIIFMVLIHVMMYPAYKQLSTPFGIVADRVLGGFMAAPIFMIAMGFGLASTRNSDPKLIIQRGLKIFILGYVLNILRGITPIIVAFIYQPEGWVDGVIRLFVGGDILHFAGLAMILFGLLKKLKNANLLILIVGLVLNITLTFTPKIISDNYALDYLLGLLIPVINTQSKMVVCFPLASWFIYVAIGNTFGIILRKCKNLNKFYNISMIIGASLMTCFATLDYFFSLGGPFENSYTAEYCSNIVYSLFSLGFALLEFGIFHYICKITPKGLNKFCFSLSNSVNEIYIISWIIIGNIELTLLGYFFLCDYEIWVYLIIFIVILVISCYLGVKFKDFKKKKGIKW